MQLSVAAQMIDAQMSGSDQLFNGVSIDSRTISQGELFVAIPGEHFDGHQYVPQAVDNGASGVMVEHVVEAEVSQLVVKDTTGALGSLGNRWRSQFEIPILGITGSNGKTTVTNLLKDILSVSHSPLAARESFNNQWGVPLTLLQLRKHHTHGVIEMGMNHPGEIDCLSKITAPTAVLINNAAAAHLEGLGSVEQVAKAKAEIINGLTDDGVVVLNADDPHLAFWREQAKEHHVVTFSVEKKADVTAKHIALKSDHSSFQINTGKKSQNVMLPLPGMHNVANALAAATLAHAVNVSLEDIATGLTNASGVPGRLCLCRSSKGAVVIDDSFNANPASTAAAIGVLKEYSGRKILVLGAMAELGEGSRQLHHQIGVLARKQGVDRLLLLTDSGNPDVEGYVNGFGQSAESYSSVKELMSGLDKDDAVGTTVLVKGSKSSRMGRVINQLIKQNNIGDESC